MKTGLVRGFKAEGGVLGLLLEDEKTGERRWFFGDRRPTFEALMTLFGDLPIPKVYGQRVAYEVTDYGALASLQDPDTVVEDDEAAEAPEG